LTEAEFQQAVIDTANWTGWLVFHPRPAQTGSRWRTAFTGHPGFPDLVLVHRDRGVIFAELKSERGKTTPGQRQWLNALEDANAETYLWRPQDFDFIVDRLRGNDV
jgi:hypothetical protein